MTRNLLFVLAALAVIMAACQSPSAAPLVAAMPTESSAVRAQPATPVPTAWPVASRTPTLVPTPSITPTSTLTPTSTPTLTLSPTITLSPTVTLTPSPIPTASPIPSATSTDPARPPDTPAPTWTPPPPDPLVQLADHYALRRPIADGAANWVARTYPYGGTSGGRLQVHLGVDMENPTGTPILAAADGTVFYAGDDTTNQFGPTTNYYGNLVVIRHNFTDSGGQPVYTLYGHMNRVEVQSGQSVKTGQQIGTVGGTGVAFGPHLHLEVRVGEPNNFGATRNPELWIFPYRTFGTLVGRVTDAVGTPLFDVTLNVKSVDITRYVFSYASSLVNADPVFNENFVLGDLPANYYEVTVSDNGRLRFQKIIYVYPNRSTWLDVQLKP